MQKLILGGALVAAVAALGVVGNVQAQESGYCREYQQNVTIGGVVRQTYGTACMQPDGSWIKVDKTGNQEVPASDVEDLQVVQAQQPVVIRQVVYEQPSYVPSYYGPPAIGLSFGFGDDWHGHGGGWHDGGGWRGGHR